MNEVSKDAESKNVKDYWIIFEVWTIWSPPEAGRFINLEAAFLIFFSHRVWGNKDAKSKMFNGCTIILEVCTIRRPLEAISLEKEANFESSFDFND